MRTSILVAAMMLAATFTPAHAAPRWAIVVHGGAGVIERKDLSAGQEAAYRAALSRATEAGAAVLMSGGSSLDAVASRRSWMPRD